MSSYSTIHQTFKTIALAEQQRMDSCATAIKIIQATAPMLVVNPPPRGPKGQGNVAKLSPAGDLIGWYRDNTKKWTAESFNADSSGNGYTVSDI